MATKEPQGPDRQARVAAQLAEQRRAERRRRLVFVGVPAVVVAAIAAAVVVKVTSGSDDGPVTAPPSSAQLDVADQIVPAAPSGQPVVQETPTTVPNTTGVDGVLAWDTQGWPGDGAAHPGALQHDHVAAPVTYAVTPPVGGPHDAIWMNAGVYTVPIPSERAVHNLEHGAVWITYRPDLSAADVTALQSFVTGQSMIREQQDNGQANRYVDLSPWADDALPSPIVISSWGYQLRVDSPTDPRLQQFVDTFRNSSTYSPEYGSPVDGIPIQTGGRPAMDGSLKPNPAGAVTG